MKIKQRKCTEFLSNQWCSFLLTFLVVVNAASHYYALAFFMFFSSSRDSFTILKTQVCVESLESGWSLFPFLTPPYCSIHFGIFKFCSFGNIRLHREGHVIQLKITVCAVRWGCLGTCTQPFYIFSLVAFQSLDNTDKVLLSRITWLPKSFTW